MSNPYPGPARPVGELRDELEHEPERRAPRVLAPGEEVTSSIAAAIAAPGVLVAGPPPGVLVTDAEAASAIAAAVAQSTGPLRILADAYRSQFAIWAGRQPGGVATEAERQAATQALARLDELVAETTVVRVKLIREIRLNDDRHMAQLAAERTLALDAAERDAAAGLGPVCGRCGTPGGELVSWRGRGGLVCANEAACTERLDEQGPPVLAPCARCGLAGGELAEASAMALDVAPGALVCADRIGCRERQQRTPFEHEHTSDGPRECARCGIAREIERSKALGERDELATAPQEAESAGGQA